MAAPSPLVIGAAQGPEGQARRLVASLSVQELRRLLQEVVRAELSTTPQAPASCPLPLRAGQPLQAPAGEGCEVEKWRSGASMERRRIDQKQKQISFDMSGLKPHPNRQFSDDTTRSNSKDTSDPHVWKSVRLITGTDGSQPIMFEDEKPSALDTVMILYPRAHDRMKRWLQCWDYWMNEVEEPERTGYLARIVSSKAFEAFFSLVIVLNAAFMAGAMNYQVENPLSPPTQFMQIADILFLLLYTVELVARLAVHRLYFFWSADTSWNIMDFCLVMYGIIDVALDYGSPSGGQSPAWMRAIRLFKMAKVLRMLRVIKSLKELHLIMACILGSMRSLAWSLVMMGVILYMFSLVFVQQASTYLGSADVNAEAAEDMIKYFGSVQKSILTLFKTIFGGDDWSTFHDLASEIGFIADWLFLFFVGFSQIALLNILTGIFVENALKLAEPSFYDKADEHHAVKQEQARVLREMCINWDANGNGALSREEFVAMVKAPRVRKFLHYLGLEVPSVDSFFNMLGSFDEEGNVDIDKFVDGCMRLRGEARSVDLNQLLFEVKCIGMSDLSRLDQMGRDIRAIKERMGRLPAEREGCAAHASASGRSPANGVSRHAAVTPNGSTAINGEDGSSSGSSTPASADQVQVSLWGRPPRSHSCLPLLP